MAVRAPKYVQTDEQKREIDKQRRYCAVHTLPYRAGHPEESLVSERKWMIDRSDTTIAVGGRHWEVDRDRAGVPIELEEAVQHGHPCFVKTAWGGSTAGYAAEASGLLNRLRNGLAEDANGALAADPDPRASAQAIVTQLSRLPFHPLNASAAGRFRILALDGGGIRGAFAAAVLAGWSQMLEPGTEVAPHFDLIAGTSTGAILAVALGLGKDPQVIKTLYKEDGPAIFKKSRGRVGLFAPRYDAARLREALTRTFERDALLADSACRLVLPSVQVRDGHSAVFTTPHSEDRTAFKGLTAVRAAMASSAAPTYFEMLSVDGGVAEERYADGGIWANSPVIPALVEAVRYLGAPIETIDVLSVGTIDRELEFERSLGGGAFQLAPKLPALFMAAQQHASLWAVEKLLDGNSRFVRVNQSSGRPIALDAVEDIGNLLSRGAEVARDTFEQVRLRFLDGTSAVPWRRH